MWVVPYMSVYTIQCIYIVNVPNVFTQCTFHSIKHLWHKISQSALHTTANYTHPFSISCTVSCRVPFGSVRESFLLASRAIPLPLSSLVPRFLPVPCAMSCLYTHTYVRTHVRMYTHTHLKRERYACMWTNQRSAGLCCLSAGMTLPACLPGCVPYLCCLAVSVIAVVCTAGSLASLLAASGSLSPSEPRHVF